VRACRAALLLTSVSPTIAVVAILFALGCALIASDVALGLFSLVFEHLRARDLDAALDSRELLRNIRLGFWAAGLLAGLAVFWRWHSKDPTLSAEARSARIKRVTACILAAVGATHLGYLLVNGASIGAMLLATLASLVAGCTLVVAHYDSQRPLRLRIGRGIVTFLSAAAVIWMWLAFDKGVSRPYGDMEDGRSVWFMIRMPEGATEKPDRKTIGVELRTPEGTTHGFASEWLDERGLLVLRGNVDLKDRSRDRTLVVTIPDRPALVFRLPFPAKPATTFDYGSWHPLDAIEEHGTAATPAGKASDYSIKYMLTR
jgi:hypothetical protein